MSHPLRGATAMVGVAQAGIGEAPGFTQMELVSQAAHQALEEAGLRLSDVDALFSGFPDDLYSTATIGQYLGIHPKFSDNNRIGGSSFLSHALIAAMALQNGLCEVALILYASTQRSSLGRLGRPDRRNPYEDPYQPRNPPSAYAMAASRHMYEYGTTREQLAEVAVAARGWANKNPEAFMHGPLTVEDVLGARVISTPFTKFDCCLVTDGAGAIVMTTAERAKHLPQKPVYLLGAAQAHWHWDISYMPDLTVTAAAESGPRAMEMAGVTNKDIDVVELYDAFTINTVLFMEDLGFCAKGEGGAFVSGGRIAPGGTLPVNTNGGGLSFCHPGMYGIFTLIEGVRQLRGNTGERQIPGAKLALCHGSGGMLSCQVTNILGTADTL